MSIGTGTWRMPHRTGGTRVARRVRPLRDQLALTSGLPAPFLVALALVPFRTDV